MRSFAAWWPSPQQTWPFRRRNGFQVPPSRGRPGGLVRSCRLQAEDARDVLRNDAEFAANAPRECSIWVDFLTAPPLPG
jgi:hypothetical protein